MENLNGHSEDPDDVFLDSIVNIDVIMHNTYMIITKKMTVDQVMDLNPDKINFLGVSKGEVPIEYDNDEIQQVIDYYASRNDFEKCVELKKCKK